MLPSAAEMLLGHLPIFEFDSVQLAQPKAIAAFLGAEFGLAGSSAFEAAEAHALCDTISDMASGAPPVACVLGTRPCLCC